jgi:hypothetical protein
MSGIREVSYFLVGAVSNDERDPRLCIGLNRQRKRGHNQDRQ